MQQAICEDFFRGLGFYSQEYRTPPSHRHGHLSAAPGEMHHHVRLPGLPHETSSLLTWAPYEHLPPPANRKQEASTKRRNDVSPKPYTCRHTPCRHIGGLLVHLLLIPCPALPCPHTCLPMCAPTCLHTYLPCPALPCPALPCPQHAHTHA